MSDFKIRNGVLTEYTGTQSNVTIPDSVTSIGEWAFYKCKNLQSIVLGKSVTSIGDSAFRRCENLQSITIPDSVTSIGDDTFLCCDNLKQIYGVPGSYAETYAKENHITFQATENSAPQASSAQNKDISSYLKQELPPSVSVLSDSPHTNQKENPSQTVALAPNPLLDKKLEHWEHRLLDLGKRNRMINYRETKRANLKLTEPSFEELYRRLVTNEETLTFCRAVDRETDSRVFSVLSLLETLGSPLPVSVGDIGTESTAAERQKTLKNLRTKARLAIEEQGTNILYLSFGFIEWKDGKGATEQLLRSPLILMPAVLTLETLHSPYKLSRHEDDIVLNPTLAHYFKTEFGIELPVFEADKTSLADYFKELEAIADKNGWRIHREANLGLLSFLKITMYKDLILNESRIRMNPVIRAMAGDTTEANTIPESVLNANPDLIPTKDCYQVMSADSSQQDAILYSKNKVSFVMQGPPGTGKSQTITNIIAEALADGKKILFVSEKMSALQVVYRRLQEANLAEFCLPLHNYKANKADILQQLGANLTLKQKHVRDTALNNLEELLEIRNELNRYAAELHELQSELKLSCYDVYGKLETLRDTPSLAFEIPDILNVTQSDLQKYLCIVKEYALALERIQYQIVDHPWEALLPSAAKTNTAAQMQGKLQSAEKTLFDLILVLDDITEIPPLSESTAFHQLDELANILLKIGQLPSFPYSWKDARVDQLKEEATRAKELDRQYEEIKSVALKTFREIIFDFDYNDWKKKVSDTASDLTALPFLKYKGESGFIRDYESLLEDFLDLKTEFERANTAFAEIGKILGLKLKFGLQTYQTLVEMLPLIDSQTILPSEWFRKRPQEIEDLIYEGESKTRLLSEYRESILADWESEVLELDPSPILLRYKTEYTGFSKNFKSQYKKDQKLLQGLSKNFTEKITDEKAISLLSLLKQYHEQEDWFETNKDRLHLLTAYKMGEKYDWSGAWEALDTIEKLRAIPAPYLSETVHQMLARNHNEEISEISENLASLGYALDKIQSISERNRIPLYMNSSSFKEAYVIQTVNKYISLLDSLQKQISRIKPYLKEELPCETILSEIDRLNDCKAFADKIEREMPKRRNTFGEFLKHKGTDWDNVLLAIKKLHEIRNHREYALVKPLVYSTPERKREIAAIARRLNAIDDRAKNNINSVYEPFEKGTFGNSIASMYSKIRFFLDHIDLFEPYADYLEAKTTCDEAGLFDFTEKLESSEHIHSAESVFQKEFYRLWLDAVCEKSASVRRFRRNVHDEKITKFIELDDLQLAIAQMRIREKLIEKLPSPHHLMRATDEVSILNKELNKRRNIMPLRKLFRSIPNLLLTLKPCLMMSPLSVSYFLETDAYHFDLVIFDEASQIFPEDAIGAITRGSQVIITGDSKQLPPTNFFSSNVAGADVDTDSDEDIYDEIISDSILEEAASALPNRTLLWHYRSKHESLIAFSNREIYRNHLITFPNPTPHMQNMGVEYIYVEDGCYESGGKNCNIREAETCVSLVEDHIRQFPSRSLGIIAFSEKQQTAIENTILDFRERNPQYEWFFDESKEEPFFVKNLENVQGDERDTIIFSICYAKDQNGKMYMRFGPLGVSGGERRLNVAVTRAKCNIKLVGSILPSDIDLDRTKSEGVKMLRSYIDFAINGNEALRPIEQTETDISEDSFRETVARFLEQNGYRVQTQVGCSDYKIDIAVEHPDDENVFIAGVECDGPSYVQAKTARDRDHLRKSVLESMGWKLCRMWSTEWLRNPKEEGEVLLKFLKEALEDHTSGPPEAPVHKERASSVSLVEITSEQSDVAADRESYEFPYYWETKLSSLKKNLQKSNLVPIRSNILAVVTAEQPIHMEFLCKQLAPTFSGGKLTESVRTIIRYVLNTKLQDEICTDEYGFLRLLPKQAIHARMTPKDATPRPPEYIHPEEIADALITIVKYSFGITVDDLVGECACIFGYERKGLKIKQKIDASLQELINADFITVTDGKVLLSESRN